MTETQYGVEIPSRIFVGGIAFDTTELELKNYFQLYGNVKDSKIITDRQGVSKGYGFITFDSQEDATRVQEQGCVYYREKKLNIGPAIRKQPGGQFHRSPVAGPAESDRQSGSTSPPQLLDGVMQPESVGSGYIYQYPSQSGNMAYVCHNGTWYFSQPDAMLQQPQPGGYYPMMQPLYSQQPQYYPAVASQVQWRFAAPPTGAGPTIYHAPSAMMPDRYIMDSALTEPVPTSPDGLSAFIRHDTSPKMGRINFPRGRRPPRGANSFNIHNKPLSRSYQPMQRFPTPHPSQQQEQPAEQQNGETKSPKPDKVETPEKVEQLV